MPDADNAVIQELISVDDAAAMEKLSHADLISVVNTVRELSEENDMAGFCNKLLNAAMEKMGAAKGLFIIRESKNNAIVQSVLAAVNSTEKTAFAESVVDYTVQKQKMILLGNVSASSFFYHDHYIQDHQPKSILCIPFVHNGKTESILYLEDVQVEKAVLKSRLPQLCFIISQAAAFLRHFQRYQIRVESETRYQRLYEQESEKAQTLAKQIVTAKMAHDVRASINAILAHLAIMKEALHDGQPLDASELAENVDQIISRSWQLLTLISRGANPDGSGSRPEDWERGHPINYDLLCID